MAVIHPKTCFIDADNRFFGVLQLKEGYYIDFDRRCIMHNGEKQKVSDASFSVLQELIRNSPHVMEFDALFDAFYGIDEPDPACSRRTIQNCICALRVFAEITTSHGVGYRYGQNVRIQKFHDVKGEDVKNIAALFSDTDEPSDTFSALEFSAKFFHAGAGELKTADSETFWKEAGRLSKIFTTTASLRSNLEMQQLPTDDLLHTLESLIQKSCEDSSPQHVLKISGPLGSYKNRLMQYLFLAVSRSSAQVLPIYMDLAYYDRIAAQSDSVLDVTQEMEKDFSVIRTFVEGHPHLTPVILLDGVHDFQYNKEVSYNGISEELERFPCKLVVCVDTGFTVNSENLFPVHPLAPHDFLYSLQIVPAKLIDRKSSVAFIRNCLNLFALLTDFSADRIYDVLMRLNFMTIDAYWLRFLLSTAGSSLFHPRQTIFSLYHTICLRYLDDANHEDAAAELAFRYEIDPASIHDPAVFQSKLWQLITKHRSVKDYLIARHYVHKIAHVDYNNEDEDAVLRELSFFNMVLPKDITRFVVPMIYGVEDYEHKIMIIAQRYYKRLSVLGKSEITFWMARLSNHTRREKCFKLLRSFAREEIERYRSDMFDNEADKKDCAFLIRGIQVSLIHENDNDALEAYLDSLIFDKTANEINRGFHLEYYGDKPFVPYNTLLDYQDEISKGENTFDVLCLALDKVRRTDRNVSITALLDLMTLCNLIQARIEASVADVAMDVTPYIGRCIDYLEFILGNRILRHLPQKGSRTQKGLPHSLPNVAKYFRWMYRSLKELLQAACERKDKKLCYHRAVPYNKFSRAYTVHRTGWVKRGVPEPENIMEHLYSCFLIAMMYLPEKTSDPLYNKSAIMQTLLIHDLGETETGDIDRVEKQLDQSRYDQEENRVMQDFLFSGSYPHAVDLVGYYQGWSDWEKKSGINYEVAKDIDNLQTIYRFCQYYMQSPSLFSSEDVEYWLSGLENLQTEAVQDIAEFLVVNNPAFYEMMEEHYKENAR